MTSHRPTRARLGLLVAALLVPGLFACEGSGRGPSKFVMTNAIFGWNPLTGDFASQGGNGEAPKIPKNMTLVFEFNDGVDAETVTTESVVVQAVDSLTGAPGPLAGVVFQTEGNRLFVSPLVTFSTTNVTFGFDDNTMYQITFAQSEAKAIRSIHGKTLEGRPGPFRFITTDEIFDRVPGPPVPTIKLIHPVSLAKMGTKDVPTSPVPLVYIDFNEGILPPSVINGDTGTSSAIRVQLDINGKLDSNPTGDRINLTGTFSFDGGVDASRMTFTPILTSIPTREPDGALYVVTVDGTVQDLTGNFSGETTRLLFRTKPGPSAVPADPIVEEFDDDQFEDSKVSSASWGERIPGMLSAGIGGGRGLDGPFQPDDPDFATRWDGGDDDPSIDVDAPAQTVTLRTGLDAEPQRQFQFTSIDVPLGWTVQGAGDHPLEILATGDVVVRGTLTVAGASAEVIPEGQTPPGRPGKAALGGESGGQGASVTDGIDGGSFGFGNPIFEEPPPDDKDGNPFQDAFSPTQGISGRSSLIDDQPDFQGDEDFGYTLEDSDRVPALSSLGITNWDSLWLQPNVACDDGRYVRWHPAFKVKALEGETLRVIDDPNDPDYQGRMSDPSNNPWLDPDTLEPAPIAETDDPYLVGDLQGHAGTDLFPYGAGSGSVAQAVAQTFLTVARAGGGGGGGAIGRGKKGQDDFTLPYDDSAGQGEGTYGAPGGGARLEGTNDGWESNKLIDNGNDGLGAFKNMDLAGYVLNPLQGQPLFFEIDSNTDSELTVVVETNVEGEEIDLTWVQGLKIGSKYWIAAPWAAGGAGGGGSGIHCAGTVKTGVPYMLPDWAPGVGGGAGGGSLRIEAAGSIDVAGTGRILADGGQGGRTTGNPSSSASGGGGGGGGTIRLQVGDAIRVTLGGLISAAGGVGGREGLLIFGGKGGKGRIRLEDFEGRLSADAFALVSDPVVTDEDIGLFLGGNDSFGQSRYYPSGVLLPFYKKIEIVYNYKSSLHPNEVLEGVYRVKASGGTTGSPIDPPPFSLEISAAAANPETGLLDSPPPDENEAPFFDPAKVDTGEEDGVLKDIDGLQFLRFRFVLPRAVKLESGERISQVHIDRVRFEFIEDMPQG